MRKSDLTILVFAVFAFIFTCWITSCAPIQQPTPQIQVQTQTLTQEQAMVQYNNSVAAVKQLATQPDPNPRTMSNFMFWANKAASVLGILLPYVAPVLSLVL